MNRKLAYGTKKQRNKRSIAFNRFAEKQARRAQRNTTINPAADVITIDSNSTSIA